MKYVFLLLCLSHLFNDPILIDLTNDLDGKWISESDFKDLNSLQFYTNANILEIDSNLYAIKNIKTNRSLVLRKFDCYKYKDENFILFRTEEHTKFIEEDIGFYKDSGILKKVQLYNDSMLIYSNVNIPTKYYKLNGHTIDQIEYKNEFIGKSFIEKQTFGIDGYSSEKYETEIFILNKTHLKLTEKMEVVCMDTIMNYNKYFQVTIPYEINKDS